MLETCNRVLCRYLLPLTLVALIHCELVDGVGTYLGVQLAPDARRTDLALTFLVAVPLLLMARNRIAYLALMALLMAVFHIGNALKIQMLGGPVLPDDLFAAHALLLIMKEWQLGIVIAVAVLLLGFIAVTLTVKTTVSRIGAAGLAVLVLAGVMVPPPQAVAFLDGRYGNIVWNQRANYESRGPLLYLTQELERVRATRPVPPAAADVARAVSVLVPDPAVLRTGAGDGVAEPAARTVVIVLLESFFDPVGLKGAKFSRDPFHKDFRRLWERTGNAHALSPVFGGYTANAEFEALCGFPVTMDAVFFEKGLTNDVPCLPRLLGQRGYTTVASHPNVPVFWNRVNAYRRLGFDAYRSIDDFVLDDMNGDYLSDDSLYRQVLENIGPLMDEGRPSLSYVVTFFGHLDYPLNENREIVVKARNGDALLERYANTVYDKSKAFVRFSQDVLRRDPDALIVAFGDHLPFLGPNFGGYTQSGLLRQNRAAFDAPMFRTMVATPLIVIDGRRGPVRTGDRALYDLPGLVRGLLGHNDINTLDLLRRAPAERTVRPLPGMFFLTGGGKTAAAAKTEACLPGDEVSEVSEACAAHAAWLAAVDVVSRDLFSGKQEVLKALPAPMPPPGFEAEHLVAVPEEDEADL